MKSVQVHLRKKDLTNNILQPLIDLKPHVVIAFADIEWANDGDFLQRLRTALSGVEVVGCSTAGEISNKGLFDKSMVLTGIRFDSADSKVRIFEEVVIADQAETGRKLGKQLAAEDLRGVFLFAPGIAIQGSSLLKGLKSVIDESTLVVGGLAGDSGKFKSTAVFHNEKSFNDKVLGLAFYGKDLELRHTAKAGFSSFGGVRQITKAQEHIVFEIDGQPALKIYKEALGKHANDLPSTGLMFPLAVLDNQQSETGLIRAVLGVDEAAQSLFLAGDVEANTFFKLMRAENKGLIAAAGKAAQNVNKNAVEGSLGFLVSCVARRMVMGEAIEDEIEAAISELSDCTNVSGFYAYGEFGPFFTAGDCQLHNQTMSVTVLSERVS